MNKHSQAKTSGSLIDQVENSTRFDQFKAIGISFNACGALFFKRRVRGNDNRGNNIHSRIVPTDKINLPSESIISFLNRIDVVSEAIDAVHSFGFHSSHLS